MVALSGMGIPAAPIAPDLIFLSIRAAALALEGASLAVLSNTPPDSLLNSIAVRLGGACAASKCSRERPPFFASSVWHTAQYFCTSAFCCDVGISSAAGTGTEDPATIAAKITA